MVITISKLILWMTWHNNLKILMQTYFRLGQWSFAEPQVWQSDWKAEQQVMMNYMMIIQMYIMTMMTMMMAIHHSFLCRLVQEAHYYS